MRGREKVRVSAARREGGGGADWLEREKEASRLSTLEVEYACTRQEDGGRCRAGEGEGEGGRGERKTHAHRRRKTKRARRDEDEDGVRERERERETDVERDDEGARGTTGGREGEREREWRDEARRGRRATETERGVT